MRVFDFVKASILVGLQAYKLRHKCSLSSAFNILISVKIGFAIDFSGIMGKNNAVKLLCYQETAKLVAIVSSKRSLLLQSVI